MIRVMIIVILNSFVIYLRMKIKSIENLIIIIPICISCILLSSCEIEKPIIDETTLVSHETIIETTVRETTPPPKEMIVEIVYLDSNMPYATYSAINDDGAMLYKHNDEYYVYYGKENNLKHKIIAINAGHGTLDGSKYKTYSHPDFTGKYSGGTNAMGEVYSKAVSGGMIFSDGSKEADVNLKVAKKLKDVLYENGYDVLMIRESDDIRLDNIARTVIANNFATCHISIHFDSTETNKGIFYIAPIANEKYLNMEPVKSNAENIIKLGQSIISAFKENGEKVYGENGVMYMDLTQISYSTIPSIDIELGDKKTKVDDDKIESYANGIVEGIEKFFS